HSYRASGSGALGASWRGRPLLSPHTVRREGHRGYTAAPMDELPAPWPPRPPRVRWWLHITLFLATFATATTAGSWFWEQMWDDHAGWRELFDPARLAHGLTYASFLLLILGAHEMGHY